MRRMTRIMIPFIVGFVLVVGFAACDDGDGPPDSKRREAQSRSDAYALQVENQPGASMGYSPTRETMNKWISEWDEPGKLSFVYLIASNGQIIGYYVLEGLPVTYCASLKPNYEFENRDVGDSNGDIMVPAPSSDGVYYSGGQCNQYYGFDATTGAYVEFSIGGSLNYLLFDEPLPVDADPLGFTVVGTEGELTERAAAPEPEADE